MAPGILHAIVEIVTNVISNSTAPDGSDPENKHAPTSQTPTSPSIQSAKRTASPSSTRYSGHRKRVERTISEVERRLVQGSYEPAEPSTAIPIPSDEWAMQPRKKMSGPFKPTNTLAGPGPGAASTATTPRKRTAPTYSRSSHQPVFRKLATETRIGDNVVAQHQSGYFDEPVSKRQKTSIKSPPRDASRRGSGMSTASKPDGWFNRDVAPEKATTLAERPKQIITIDSQDSAIDDIFNSSKEVRATDDLLFPRRHKKRKPHPNRSGSSSQNDQESVLSLPQSTQSHSIEPKTKRAAQDDIEFVESRPARKARIANPGRRDHISSRISQSSPVRPSPQSKGSIQVPSVFETGFQDQGKAQNRAQKNHSQRAAATESIIRPRALSDVTPRLSETFTRDTTTSHNTGARLVDKMLKSSVKTRLAVEAIDGSEDELAGDHWADTKKASQAPRKKVDPSKVKGMVRQPSPGDIKPTPFTKSSRATKSLGPVVKDSEQEADEEEEEGEFIPLKKLKMNSKEFDDRNMGFMYLPGEKAFALKIGEKSLRNPSQQTPWRLTSNNARMLHFSSNASLKMVLTGSKDDFVQGKICLEFYSSHNLQAFLEGIMEMTGERVRITDVEKDDAMEKVFNNASEILENGKIQDPELLAMEIRQEKSGRAIASLPTAANVTRNAANVTKKRTVQSDLADQKDGSPLSGQVSGYFLPPRSSQRNQEKVKLTEQEPELEQWTKVNGLPQWDGPLIYPATGPRRTTIEVRDIERLDDGEFLNDNLISFALRQLEEANPHLKEKVHIFNTFFYTSLSTTKGGKKGFNYDAVKRWTKDIKICDIPYIVVPVNLNFHWFVAIICNLDKLDKKVDVEEVAVEEEEEMLLNELEGPAVEDDLQSGLRRSPIDLGSADEHAGSQQLSQGVKGMSIDSEKEYETQGVCQVDNDGQVFEFDNGGTQESGNTADDLPELSKLKPAAVVRKGKNKAQPTMRKYNPNTPAIITLDSLGGSHYPEVRHLKEYVIAEAREKQGQDIGREELQGVLAKGIPEQDNFCDCGVYLVGYIRQFLKDPAEFVRKALSRELDPNKDFPDFNASDMRMQLRDQLLVLGDEQKAAKRAKKKEAFRAKQAAKQGEGSAVAAPPAADGEAVG